MTATHVRRSKDLSGQYPILTGRCLLTGIHLRPCTVFSCFFFFSGLKNNKYTSGKSTYINLGEATSGESTFGRNNLLPFGWLVAGVSTITSFEVFKGYYNMMPSVKWQTFNNLRSEQIS